jgi:class 3 adenylate cyclase
MSATPDSTFTTPEQLIADLQRQLAECKAERDAGLQRETATAEVLQVVNSYPGDLVPVFDAILEKALRLCGAAYGHVFRVEGDLGHAVAARGDPEFVEWLLKQGPVRPTPGGILHRMMQGERVVQIPDSTDTDVYRSGTITREIIDRSGVRTTLGVALRNDRALLGAIFVNRREAHPFSDKEITLLETFAAQAVIAMENARLLTETREALEQQTATAEVLQVINSSRGDPTPVFDAILEKAHTVCGADSGALMLYDGERLYGVATRGYPEEYARLVHKGGPPHPVTAFQRLRQGERLVHVPDAAALQSPPPMTRAAIEIAGVRTSLFIPLRRDGALLGYISAQRREVRPYSDQEIALLENFATQAVIAMENARLLGELRQRTDEVAELNRGLEARVAEQVEELGRVGRLKRFLAPQLAELIVSQGDENILESHRREIVVVFCDLRGYTAFTETAEPEEVLDFLREYHGALGPLVSQFEGTLDQFSGDGIMVFFNDPVPCPDPAERAVKMAMAMREAAGTLIAVWRRRGRVLGFGAGIAQGYATLGQIGFADRSGYTAIGTVCNLAARLCAEAKDGQILVAQRVAVAVEEITPLEEVGGLTLKGLTQPVVAYNVPFVNSQAAFRVIEGGAPSA